MFLPSQPQPQQAEHKPSRQYQLYQSLAHGSLYAFWFSLGLTIAHLARLAAALMIYMVFVAVVGSFLWLYQPESATEETLSLRRLSGLAVFLSLTAYWDGVLTLANLPIYLGVAVIPLWQLLLVGSLIGALALPSVLSRR